MNTNDERVQIAVAAIEQLEAIHQQFIRFVQSLPSCESHAGKLTVKGDDLVANCLGVELTVRRKIVVRNSYPALVEYAFVVPKHGVDIFIFALYLGKDGSLLTDPLSEIRLCDFNNTYLAHHLLNAIAIKLLDSEVFKPTTHSPRRFD